MDRQICPEGHLGIMRLAESCQIMIRGTGTLHTIDYFSCFLNASTFDFHIIKHKKEQVNAGSDNQG